MTRADELAANLADVQARIDRACEVAGRLRTDVTLVAVTKTWPAADCLLLRDLGVLDLAENRDQEAAGKAREVASEVDDVRWHFVGAVQTNKARSVAAYADVVHAVDRPSLITALDRAERPLAVLLQVSLDGDPARGGALAAQIPALAEQVSATSWLQLRGVMAVAPLGANPARAFADLAATADELRRNHPLATWISAGMSGDLEQAVAAGATHVRVGTALLGHRPPVLR